MKLLINIFETEASDESIDLRMRRRPQERSRALYNMTFRRKLPQNWVIPLIFKIFVLSFSFIKNWQIYMFIRWVLEAHASRDHILAGPLWEGYRESKRCSKDTYAESYITKHTSIRRLNLKQAMEALILAWGDGRSISSTYDTTRLYGGTRSSHTSNIWNKCV